MEERQTPESRSEGHVPVLLSGVLSTLDPREGDVAADLTAGRGGHAREIAGRVGPSGRLVLVDADAGNLAFAGERVRAFAQDVPIEAFHANFVDAPRLIHEAGLRADVVLADLGYASNQIDDPDRGMSFRADGPLDMRFDRSGRGPTAGELVNTLGQEELAQILWEFGEERGSRRIAQKIREERERSPIESTGRLASLVVDVLGPRGGGPKVHPATRTFQALRIAVNDELGSLRSLLESVRRGAEASGGGGARRAGWLAPGARIGIIAFHSLEDRMIKRAFAELTRRGLARSLSRSPVQADEQEVRANARARSAKLRAIVLNGG
ncbi:MAG: 16S rRNA (cytosine(1402)-N(4))-methyltransferase RsmH [Phycisphaerales bacterium]